MVAKNMSVNLHCLTTKINILLIYITAFTLGDTYCNIGDLQQDASGQWYAFICSRAKKKKP